MITANKRKYIKNLVAAVSLPFRGWGGGRGLSALMYHKIVPDTDQPSNIGCTLSCSAFERHLQYFRSHGYHILSAPEMLECLYEKKAFPSRSVIITFDDGSVDNYRYAYPLLKKYQVPALIFLTAGYIGTERVFWWDKIECWLRNTKKEYSSIDLKEGRVELPLRTYQDKINAQGVIDRFIKSPGTDINAALSEIGNILEVGQSPLERSAMSWQEVIEMQNAGISFGAHTVNHVNLSQADERTAFDEINCSKKIVEDNLQKKVDIFAYPYGGVGDYSPREIKLLKNSGFLAAFTTHEGKISPHDDPFTLKRLAISGDDNDLIFKAKISGSYGAIYRSLYRIAKKYGLK